MAFTVLHFIVSVGSLPCLLFGIYYVTTVADNHILPSWIQIVATLVCESNYFWIKTAFYHVILPLKTLSQTPSHSKRRIGCLHHCCISLPDFYFFHFINFLKVSLLFTLSRHILNKNHKCLQQVPNAFSSGQLTLLYYSVKYVSSLDCITEKMRADIILSSTNALTSFCIKYQQIN